MQEVIVYRSPMEAALWHAADNGGAALFVVVIVLALVWAVAYCAAAKFVEVYGTRTYFYSRRNGYELTFAWVVTLATAAAMWFWGR